MVEIVTCDQNTEVWFRARMGIPTASEFSTVMAKGRGGGDSKTRQTYLYKLAGEIITGEPMESFSNAHMERGKVMEDEARDLYEFMTDYQCERVGFIRSGRKGASPDSLIGTAGMVEIKTKLPHLMIEAILRGDFPPEHKAQCQGQLWVAEREWIDIAAYWPGMPLFTFRATRATMANGLCNPTRAPTGACLGVSSAFACLGGLRSAPGERRLDMGTKNTISTAQPENEPLPQTMAANVSTPKLVTSIPPEAGPSAPPIAKPGADFMNRFRSTKSAEMPGVATPLAPLKIIRAGETEDFFRVHPDEENYWTCELCFVSVPVKGTARPLLHLITEEIAMEYLSPKLIKRHRLALATKPYDVLFFCSVPSQNLDSAWNATALTALDRSKSRWTQVFSRRDEGLEEYGHKFAQNEDAFPAPKWPLRSVHEYLEVTFRDASITTSNHPGLLRLIGAKQDLK